MSETITQKIQPQSIEAEMSVLGAMLIDKEAIYKAVESLIEDAFYKTTHRKIYSTILDLFERDKPVDLVTLTNELKKKGELSNIGGAIYLTTILNTVPTSANVEYYIKIVKDKYIRRQLIELGNEIINKSFAISKDTENIDIITFGQQGMDKIIRGLDYGSYISTKELLHNTFDVIDKKYQWTREKELVGMSTGYIDLDTKLGGLKNGDLIIIAGRPSMGKSALGLNILFNLSKAGIKTGLFSIESGKDAIINRLLAMGGKVDLMGLTTGYLKDTDFPKLTTIAGKISNDYAIMYINDTGG
ncbi:MAG: DnaB-like helicase N-terminal domain-containing protein, partial [bacterium]